VGEDQAVRGGFARGRAGFGGGEVRVVGLRAIGDVGGFGEHEVGALAERVAGPARSGVGGVDEALAVGRRLDGVGGRRVLGASEPQVDPPDRGLRGIVDRVPLEGVAPIAVDELAEVAFDALGAVDREPGPL
jgi:hypothetical protein